MKQKTIRFKSGRITLYDKNTDDHFIGSLMVKTAKRGRPKIEKTEVRADILAEVLTENFSQNLDAVIQSLHIKNAQSEPQQVELETVKKSNSVPEVILISDQPQETETKTSEIKSKPEDPEDPEDEGPDLFRKEPPIEEKKTVKTPNKLEEYWDLIDFPALFKFLFHNFSNLLKKLKFQFEEHFYIEDVNPATGPTSEKEAQLPISEQYKSLESQLSKGLAFVKNKILNNSQTLIKSAAIACLLVAVLSISSILLPLSTAQISSMVQKSNAQKTEQIKQAAATPDPQRLLAQALEVDPSKDAQISNEYILEVPKIGLVSGIAPNVDLDNEEVYKQKLKETGVAHAKGSYFPGEVGPVFLFAHSTDTVFNISAFNAKFFALKDLEEGDEIKVNYHGNKHTYKVTGKTIINPDELDTIRNADSSLILQTCWPPGTDWQRLIVFAKEQTGVASN